MVELGRIINHFRKPWPCSWDGLQLASGSTGSSHPALPSLWESVNVQKLLLVFWRLLLYGS